MSDSSTPLCSTYNTLTYSPFDWYNTPEYYDIIFYNDKEIEAEALLSILQQYYVQQSQEKIQYKVNNKYFALFC